MIKLNHFPDSVTGKVRKANEDSIGSLTNKQTNGYGDIFVVCDGMGGHVGGATASQTAVKCILEYFEQANSNPIVALAEAIQSANQQIFGLAQQDHDLKGMGTTCTVLLCKEDKIYIAHVGDSRIYINTDNKLYRITKDHSFVQKLVDAGQLEDSEMETHPRKNELTKALGIAANVEVEVAEDPILVKSGDKFLMCSDGLCGLVNDLTIENAINSTSGLETVNELIQLAMNAGGNDNISVDIIDVIQSPHSKTIFKDQGNKSFTATQVLDIPSKKGDRKLITIFKRYQVYILSTLLVLLLGLGYFTSEVINGNITFNKVYIPEEESIAVPVETTENSVQDSDSTRGVEVKKENVSKSTQNTWGDRTQKDAEKEEEIRRRNRITDQKKILLIGINNKLEEVRNKMNEKYQRSDPYAKLIKRLNTLKAQKEKVNKQHTIPLLNTLDEQIKETIKTIDTAWDKLEKHINKQELKEAINDARKKKDSLNISIVEEKNIKAKLDSYNTALKGDNISVIEKSTEELKKKVNEVRSNQISRLKNNGYVEGKYEIDKQKIYDDYETVGGRIFYKYPAHYRLLNEKYKKEQSFIEEYEKQGYVKEENCQEGTAVWFYAPKGKQQNKKTESNIFTKDDLNKLTECLGKEQKTQKYCLPRK